MAVEEEAERESRKGSELSIDISRGGFGPMARPLRIEYPVAIYRVLSRGDRREAIVKNDADRQLFFELITGSI